MAGSVVFMTTSGDLEVGAAADKVEVKATSGNVRLGELSHGARIANVSGDVRVLALGEGSLHVRSVSGDVSVGIAEGVDLHVDVETLSGSVHSDIPLDDAPAPGHRDAQVDLSVRSVSGNVEIARALEAGRLIESRSRSWWQTASSMIPNGSNQNVAKYGGGYWGHSRGGCSTVAPWLVTCRCTSCTAPRVGTTKARCCNPVRSRE